MQAYSDPERESDPYALPDVEVFYVWPDEAGETCPLCDCTFPSDPSPEEHESHAEHVGYYYWYCFPGCLPDSEPIGPFESEEAALEDCRDNA